MYGRPDSSGEFEFTVTVIPCTEDGERTWRMECDDKELGEVLRNVDVEMARLFVERGWVGDEELRQEIHVVVKWDYYAEIPSADRDVPPDPEVVEWYFECFDKEFHERVLDKADERANDVVTERVCEQEA